MLSAYLHEVTGAVVMTQPVPEAVVSPLPLYLRAFYDFRDSNLFGRNLRWALQKSEKLTLDAQEYIQHVGKLRSAYAGEVVLVVPRMTAPLRRRLVQKGIPFVVPGRQMFLPHLLIDLRERFDRERNDAGQPLSAVAHVVVLRHLLGRPVTGLSLRELAASIRYSAMAMSYMRDELETHGLCRSQRQGRSAGIAFVEEGAALWNRVHPLLRSPVKARHWARWNSTAAWPLFAGLTALARVSLVTDDVLPTCAMKDSDYRHRLERGEILRCDGPEEAQLCIESWRYDPRLLSDGPAVDPLSLYLSLRDTGDERVAKAAKALVEEQSW